LEDPRISQAAATDGCRIGAAFGEESLRVDGFAYPATSKNRYLHGLFNAGHDRPIRTSHVGLLDAARVHVDGGCTG
jgi:hypothetical protein